MLAIIGWPGCPTELHAAGNMRGEYSRKANASHVFIHIAKNGGGSAYEYLRECRNVQVPFGAHKISVAMVLAVNRSAIVVLRDPADRVISEYQWSSSLDLGKDYDDHVHHSHVRPHDTAPQGMSWNATLLPALLAHAKAHLKPQAFYTGGASLNDSKVTVLCTEQLSLGLEQISRRLCNAPTSHNITRAVPWLHRTQAPGEGVHYNMTEDLRQVLRRAYAQDTELHQRYCSPSPLPPPLLSATAMYSHSTHAT